MGGFLTFYFLVSGSRPAVKKVAGNMASLSGADDNLYTEFRKAGSGAKHPLFKKFRK